MGLSSFPNKRIIPSETLLLRFLRLSMYVLGENMSIFLNDLTNDQIYQEPAQNKTNIGYLAKFVHKIGNNEEFKRICE